MITLPVQVRNAHLNLINKSPMASSQDCILFVNQAVYLSPAVIIGHLTHCEVFSVILIKKLELF